MKNSRILLAVIVVITFSFQSSAQWAVNGTSIYNTNTGNVGIGLDSPSNLLEVAKDMTGPQIIIHNLGGLGGAGFTMIDDASGGNWKFKSLPTGGFKIRDHSGGLNVLVMEANSAENSIVIKTGGNIGIGTYFPTSKLSVNGKIGCKEVEVTLTGWSDYVFTDEYRLRTLSEVETFINENNHLPGVPSEEEVIEKGINLGQMDALLLEKIEELTLYMIDLKKENEEIKVQIEELKGE